MGPRTRRHTLQVTEKAVARPLRVLTMPVARGQWWEAQSSVHENTRDRCWGRRWRQAAAAQGMRYVTSQRRLPSLEHFLSKPSVPHVFCIPGT